MTDKIQLRGEIPADPRTSDRSLEKGGDGICGDPLREGPPTGDRGSDDAQSREEDDMFVRTSTVITTPASIDQGTRYLQDEAMPELTALEGFVGLSCLVDRHMARCVTATAWQTIDTMRASEPAVAGIRGRYAAMAEGEESTVDEWEVALMHRVHTTTEGSAARVTWLEGDPYAIEDSIDAYRGAMPTLEGLPGFASASLLLDRRTAQAVSTVVYDTPEALVRSRTKAGAVRTRVAEETGTEIIEVADFEVALSHLRVPELV